jgi:hypothetical protein
MARLVATDSFAASNAHICASLNAIGGWSESDARVRLAGDGFDMDGGNLGVWQTKRVWFRHTVLLRLRPLAGRLIGRLR